MHGFLTGLSVMMGRSRLATLDDWPRCAINHQGPQREDVPPRTGLARPSPRQRGRLRLPAATAGSRARRAPTPHTPDGLIEREQRCAHRQTERGVTRAPRRQALAVDGKCLRGAKRPNGSRVFGLSAVRHGDGITLASREIGTKTNEIPEFAPLLDQIDDCACSPTAASLLITRAFSFPAGQWSFRWTTRPGRHYRAAENTDAGSARTTPTCSSLGSPGHTAALPAPLTSATASPPSASCRASCAPPACSPSQTNSTSRYLPPHWACHTQESPTTGPEQRRRSASCDRPPPIALYSGQLRGPAVSHRRCHIGRGGHERVVGTAGCDHRDGCLSAV